MEIKLRFRLRSHSGRICWHKNMVNINVFLDWMINVHLSFICGKPLWLSCAKVVASSNRPWTRPISSSAQQKSRKPRDRHSMMRLQTNNSRLFPLIPLILPSGNERSLFSADAMLSWAPPLIWYLQSFKIFANVDVNKGKVARPSSSADWSYSELIVRLKRIIRVEQMDFRLGAFR